MAESRRCLDIFLELMGASAEPYTREPVALLQIRDPMKDCEFTFSFRIHMMVVDAAVVECIIIYNISFIFVFEVELVRISNMKTM